ncbi:DUF3784 domain-containing protein [Halobacillus ihumii]|uniref:DUF3784 domain-containing protein n=1 Tax=Halobacillus ihumii TaxID=2686092 RepID=UPI0019676988|nr:DUF3784 domain-containing protein [Halobacillus ihumii]
MEVKNDFDGGNYVNGAIVHFIILIPFLIFATLLSKGKGAYLLTGYNTMSDHEKAQYDEVALCKFMGKVMYGICFSILLWALSGIFEIQILFIIGLVLCISLIVFALVYSNTGNRFKNIEGE